MEMTDKPHSGDRQHILGSSGNHNHGEESNQGDEFEWSNDPLPDDWKQYFLRKKCIALVGVVSILLIAVVALIASNHVDGDSDEARAQYAMANKPATFCKTPKDGELPGLSKAAFAYWSAINPRPTHSQIIMLGDGYGPEVHTMARSVKRYMKGDMSLKMALDPHMVGQSITSSSSNIITDSAAGATAYSAGHKTYNGAISVIPRTPPFNRKCADSNGGKKCPSPDGEEPVPSPGRECCEVDPIAHAFEGCRAKGMATGLVVTTVLPHATPASWSSHAMVRSDLEFIAQQQIEHDPPIDVILGGGRALFDYHRQDGRDLLAEHADTHTIVRTAGELETERLKWESNNHHAAPLKPLLGLFADHDLQYEVDRAGYQGGREPHLKDMVAAALTRLEATGKKYCLMIEGSHIDFALHANDAGAAVHEALAFDEAVDVVMTHAHMRNRDDVSVVSLADHSTGGSTLGMQRDWNITYGQNVCTNPPDATEEADQDESEKPKPPACTAQMGTYAYDSTDGWSPLVLANARSSVLRLAQKLCCEPRFRENPSLRMPFIEEALQIKTGVDPERPWADIEQGIDDAIKKLADDFECMKDMHESVHGLDAGVACTIPAEHVLRTMQQYEARVGFTTGGHTSVDINLYAAGVDKLKYMGAHENSKIGKMMIQSLGLDLDPITQALKDCKVRTFPEPPKGVPQA